MAIRSRSWTELLKILGVLATVAGSAIGSYKAAKSDARVEAAASYETMKEAIDHLEQNQKMIWDVLMKMPNEPTKSFAPPTISPNRPFVGMRPLPRDLGEAVAQRKLFMAGK